MLIEKYTFDWVNNFNDLKKELEKVLNGVNHQIEHVGSTSVPFLDSKNIIDIDIIYSEVADFEIIKFKLAEAGYFHNGNQGIENREVFKRSNDVFHPTFDRITHHLYVCPTESKALKRHLLSRNFLRKNDWARLKYQEMKYRLAEEAGQDKKKYAALKEAEVNDFIDSIVEQEDSMN